MSQIVTSTEGFFIQNLNPQIASIYPKFKDNPYTGFDSNILILDFGKKNKGELATTNLVFSGKGFKNVTGSSSSCSCTQLSTQKDGDNFIVTVQYDPNRIAANISKVAYVIFDGVKQLKINLIINR